jgi:hypothetical protein
MGDEFTRQKKKGETFSENEEYKPYMTKWNSFAEVRAGEADGWGVVETIHQ